MFESDLDFRTFLITRNWRKVRGERFVETPAETFAHNYQNETENHRLLIRAQARTEGVAA